MSENSPVRHRIDGLEITQPRPPLWRFVRHRIDGLEKWQMPRASTKTVRHRIDGLEIQR